MGRGNDVKCDAIHTAKTYEEFAKSLSKTKRFGVKCASEQTKRSVVEESIITNDLLDKIYKDTPNVNFADFVVMDEDCGNVSGVVTQNSDLVENKPVEKEVRPKEICRKRKAKSIVRDEPRKDPIDIGKSNLLVKSVCNTTSPIISTKATLTRKRRKLYSPKDDENENKEITISKIQLNVNQTPIATCYRELENARQPHSRISRKSRAKKSKKSRCSMYSDGEDPSFEIRVRPSSIGSTTTMSRRERPVTPVNYILNHYTTMLSSSEDSDFEQRNGPKPKMARKIKPSSRKVEKTSRTKPVLSPKTKKKCEKSAVLESTEIIEPALVSDVMSERSIATGGRSPITGHNDLNEPPPNVEALDEAFQHRDVHNEGVSESMPKLLTNMRNQLETYKPTASLTSVIPITRMSKPKIVLERLSSDEINRWQRMPNFKDTDRCDVNRSIQDRLNRNATPKSPSAADNHDRMLSLVSQVMKTTQTTLAVHHAIGESLPAALKKNHEEITCLKNEVQEIVSEAMQHVNIRVEKKIEQLEKNHRTRMSDVIRDDEQKARMVKLLQEEIQRLQDLLGQQ